MNDLITRLEESNGDYSTDEILDYIKSLQVVVAETRGLCAAFPSYFPRIRKALEALEVSDE